MEFSPGYHTSYLLRGTSWYVLLGFFGRLDCVLGNQVTLTGLSLTHLCLLLFRIEIQAKIPGMEWISDYDEGKLKVLINSYLPVVGLLALIMILPIIFQAIATKYEKRKTLSDVNRSIVSRYFYYQVRVRDRNMFICGCCLTFHNG